MRTSLIIALFVLLAAAPTGTAGSAEAPELTDAAGDCGQPWGNEYADIVSAWISDETETSFMANIALAKWTADALGTATGYTLQFEHQGVQFGAVAFYGGAAAGGWQFNNAYIDLDTGQSSEFVPAEGSFTPGTPAVIAVEFDKGFFPHNMPDNALRSFAAGSADFKAYFPLFLSPVPAPATPADGVVFDTLVGCDIATSDAEYVFAVGGHSMHEAAAQQEADEAANATQEAVASSTAPTPLEAEGESPSVGLAWVALAAAVVFAARRRHA